MTDPTNLAAEKVTLQRRMERTQRRIKEMAPVYRKNARELADKMVALGDKAHASGYRLSYESLEPTEH